MERKINYLSICYTLFLILLLLSGRLSGIFSEVVYFLAFLLPILLGLLLDKRTAAEDKRTTVEDKSLLTISKADLKVTLPLIVPTVLLIMLVSVVTSAIIVAITGAKNQVDVGNSIVTALISHALVPAILEEALFRYLPMKLLLDESKRLTVITSALFFALAHHNLFSIPYAFIAGIIFMAIDVGAKSVIPSVILHFVNNAVSVGMLVYADNKAFTPTLMTLLCILLVISLIFIVKNKEMYLKEFKSVIKKDRNLPYTTPLVIFTLICLFIAVISLM